MTQFEQARERERGYHTAFYAKHNLGDPDTWMSEPTPYAVKTFELITPHPNPRALDLGSGIGRHAIPLAKYLGADSEVVCIDLLNSANKKLRANAARAGVAKNITDIVGDVGTYTPEGTFDYVLSVSCIEHVNSREQLGSLIGRLKRATRSNGVHCFMLQTNYNWSDAVTGEPIKPVVELDLSTNEAMAMLRERYGDWHIKNISTKEWKLAESVHGRNAICKSTCVQFTVINKARRQ